MVRRFGVRRDGIVPSACARLVLRFASSPSSYNIIALSKAYPSRTPKRAGVRRWLASGENRSSKCSVRKCSRRSWRRAGARAVCTSRRIGSANGGRSFASSEARPMPGRFGPSDFAACGRCGSGQVHPNLLVMGPIAGVDSDSRSYVCHACGHVGLPIFFDTESARAQFEREKKGIWEPRYNASRIYMLDLAGINRANPNFDVTRHLGKRCDVWLDSGGREPEEVMDGYMLDVERVVAGSKTLASLDSFAALYALSSEVLPCLDWDGKVVWREPSETHVDLLDVAKSLRGIGFSAVCVMDLRRLGSELGPDPTLLSPLEGPGLDVYVGGGLQESDVLRLGERGFAGGLVDPYTAGIRDLLNAPKPEAPTEAIAPAPAPRPASAPRSVPDSTGLP